MRKKWWLLAAIIVGCAAGVATMTITIPSRTFHSSTNGTGHVTIDGLEGTDIYVPPGDYDEVTGTYPYVIPHSDVPKVPSGVYTATLAVTQIGYGEAVVIGGCTLNVNAEAGIFDVDWFDGSIPGGGGMGL